MPRNKVDLHILDKIKKHMKKPTKIADRKGTIARLLGYISRQKRLILIILGMVSVSTILDLIGPYLIGVVIDDYISLLRLDGLFIILGIMLLIYISSIIITWSITCLNIDIAQNTVKSIRDDLFKKIQTLSIRFFDKRPDGDLISRFTNDIDNISTTLTQTMTDLISGVMMLFGMLIMMLTLCWQLALVIIFMMPITIFLTNIIGKYSRVAFKKNQSALGDLNTTIEEIISAQKVVKAFGQEEKSINQFSAVNNDYKKAAIKSNILGIIMGPIMNTMNNLIYIVIVMAGSLLVIKGYTSIGIIVVFLSYARQIAGPINQLAGLYNNIQSAIAGAERVFEILDEVPEMQDVDKSIQKSSLDGDVVFNNVTFGYNREAKVLKNINISARKGESIALVGPTGAGKTTISNLLTRFYDIDDGDILIDGQPIKMYEKANLRRNVGIVLQDIYLFSGTVMDNIRYGRLTATDEEVIKAAKLANAHHFIKRLPDGYNTYLSEEGNNFSQGQRQILSIARTILADPDILILDEATSSVDTRTELHIQEALKKLMHNRTSFIIAHRLSTIKNADMILVIKDGRIVERGKHTKLLSQKGVYYNLYNAD
jgi:ATP-binding cassette subfamily B multidrug efflux pump